MLGRYIIGSIESCWSVQGSLPFDVGQIPIVSRFSAVLVTCLIVCRSKSLQNSCNLLTVCVCTCMPPACMHNVVLQHLQGLVAMYGVDALMCAYDCHSNATLMRMR
jgi:hypothetical protein